MGKKDIFFVKALKHSRQLIKCSLTDHFVGQNPISVVFFYSDHIPAEQIITSLQHVLNDFPIFAGTLTMLEDQLYIDCNNQGVQVHICQSSDSLQKIQHFHKLPSNTFVDSINPHRCVKKGTPVLTIKLNYYIDGMTIGYCWHHSVSDMSSFMQFLIALSSAAKNQSYPIPSFTDDRESYFHRYLQPKPDKISLSRFKYLTFFDICKLLKCIYSMKQNVYIYFTKEEISKLKEILSEKSNCKLSRNDVVCAHLLHHIASCRQDTAKTQNASMIVNLRPHLKMPSSSIGNYIDALAIQFDRCLPTHAIARTIHSAVQSYCHNYLNPWEALEFIEKNGGMKKIGRIMPCALLPKHKNLIFTNWTNFNTYSIDFGKTTPYLFMPIGTTLLPWVAGIVEGIHNQGLLVALVLPSQVAKRVTNAAVLQQIHQYRDHLSLDEALFLKQNPWCS